jgi:hypothetical protein
VAWPCILLDGQVSNFIPLGWCSPYSRAGTILPHWTDVTS